MLERVMSLLAIDLSVEQRLGCSVLSENWTSVGETCAQGRRWRLQREWFQALEDLDCYMSLSALRRRVREVPDCHEAGRLVIGRIAVVEHPDELLERIRRSPCPQQGHTACECRNADQIVQALGYRGPLGLREQALRELCLTTQTVENGPCD